MLANGAGRMVQLGGLSERLPQLDGEQCPAKLDSNQKYDVGLRMWLKIGLICHHFSARSGDQFPFGLHVEDMTVDANHKGSSRQSPS